MMGDKESFLFFGAILVVVIVFIAILTRGTGKKIFYGAIARVGIILVRNILIRLPFLDFGDNNLYLSCPFSYNESKKECEGKTSREERGDNKTMSIDAAGGFIIAFLPIILYGIYVYINSQEEKNNKSGNP